jgi:hypothetical protein
MKSRWFFCLLASAAVMLSGNRAAAQGSTLLVDNFTKDSSLNTNLWTTNSSFLDSLAAASSSPPASFVTPQLSFARSSGMQMTGPTEDFQTTGVQSLSTFIAPFKVVADVVPTQGTANTFAIYLASTDLTQYVSLSANVSPTYNGFWVDAPNIAQLGNLGERFSPPVSPALNTLYKIEIAIDAQGIGTTTLENSSGTILGSVSNLQAGTGPFYLVLGQRIGLAPPGTQVADWRAVSVSAPLFTTITVQDVTTGLPISNGQTLASSDKFQVTVTTNDVNCAGQYTVTALGAPGVPPSVLVQVVPYIIGPASRHNSVTGGILSAGVLPSGYNDWKISSSCGGAQTGQFAFSHFEFFVKVD